MLIIVSFFILNPFLAMMEYHVAGQLPVANKILALAHTKFPDEIDLVIRYLNFLLSVNDENSKRLFMSA